MNWKGYGAICKPKIGVSTRRLAKSARCRGNLMPTRFAKLWKSLTVLSAQAKDARLVLALKKRRYGPDTAVAVTRKPTVSKFGRRQLGLGNRTIRFDSCNRSLGRDCRP